MFAAVPDGVEMAAEQAAPGEVRAFARVEPSRHSLGVDAIAVHAMIEFIFAPPRADTDGDPRDEARVETAATVVLAAAAAEPTPAVEPSTAAAALPSVGERGRAALARIPVSPGSVGFTIEFLAGRDGYGGLTYPDTRRIEIFVSSSWSDAHLAHVVAHEIGHAFDMTQNSRADREQWRAARGIAPTTRWWADPYTSDFATPGGDFAECFAAWSVGSSSTRSAFGSCAGTESLMSALVWG